jgi:hypothetical protein
MSAAGESRLCIVSPAWTLLDDYTSGMCGRVIQSSGPLRYAIVDGMNVRDSRVHNHPPRWNAAPSQELLVIRRNHRTGEVALDPLRWVGRISLNVMWPVGDGHNASAMSNPVDASNSRIFIRSRGAGQHSLIARGLARISSALATITLNSPPQCWRAYCMFSTNSM